MLLALFTINLAVFASDGKLFSLFPIPLKSSVLKIRFNKYLSAPFSVELRNVIGRKLFDKSFQAGVDEVSINDMDTYPNGLYVVLVKDAQGKVLESSKFMIER